MARVIGIRHTGIVVNDLEQSKKFYCDFLGFKIISEQLESGRYIEMMLGMPEVEVTTVKMRTAEDQSMIELLKFHNQSPISMKRSLKDPGTTHIALTVNNIEEIFQKIQQRFGLEFISSPVLVPCGKAKVCFCREPGGSFLELVEEL